MPNEMTVIHENNEYALIIKNDTSNEKYYLDRAPEPTSSLVKDGYNKILKQLELDKLIQNLEMTADLIYLAYNGVADADDSALPVRIHSIERNLATACTEALLVIHAIRTGSSDIVHYISQTHKWLLNGEETLAQKQLRRCEEHAMKMANEASRLAEIFVGINKETGEAHDAVLVAQKAERQKLEAARQKRIKLQDDIETSKEQLRTVLTMLQDLQEEIIEAKAVEAEEADRAFIMGLVNSFTKVATLGLGTLGGEAENIYANQIKSGQFSDANEKLKTAFNKLTDDEQNINNRKTELTKKVQRQSDLKAEIEDMVKKAGNATSPEEKDKLKAALELKENDLQKLSSDISTEDSAIKEETLKVNKNRDFFDSIGDITQKQESIMKRSTELLRQKHEMRMKELDTMKNIRSNITALKLNEIMAKIAASTATSLGIASSALSKIIAILHQAILFWKSMAQHCNELANSKTAEMVGDVQSLSLEKRIREYTSKEFMSQSVYYMAGWVALILVCNDYYEATQEARTKILDNIAESPSISKSNSLVLELADKLGIQYDNLIAEEEKNIAASLVVIGQP